MDNEKEIAALMKAALAKLGPLHPHERLGIPPMIKGKDVESPWLSLDETVAFFKKQTRS
jgi:hypothetical protein